MTIPRKMALQATAIVVLAVSALLILRPPSSVRAVYPSPSGNYRLVVHSYYRLFAMPGDSTGSAGYVELFDRTRKTLAQAKIPLVLDVSSLNDIHWYDDAVTVPGVFDFPISHP